MTDNSADLNPITSEAGRAMLDESIRSSDFPRLAAHFVTQANLAYCGVASGCMVLNGLGVPRPESSPHGAFRLFTQDNFFTDEIESFLPSDKVRKEGMPLANFGRAIQTHGAETDTRYGSDISLPEFREEVAAAIADPTRFVVVNYSRELIGQEGPGHISPLGAYSSATDSFLIMDVATYRYPFVWVPAAVLHTSIAAIIPEAEVSRGYCLVSEQHAT